MGDFDKNAKCNKLLRKAVQVGDIDLVELILAIAADRGMVIRISKVLHIVHTIKMSFWYACALYSGS